MHHVNLQPPDRLAKRPRGAGVELVGRLDSDDVETRLAGPREQRFTAAARDDRVVAEPLQSLREPERLPLAAAPSALGIDVEDAQSHGGQLPSPAGHAQGAMPKLS